MKREGRQVEFTHTLRRDGHEHEVDVVAYVSAFDPGCTSGPPERWYPPEGGTCQYTFVTEPGGVRAKLTDDEMREIEERAEMLAAEMEVDDCR